MNDDEEKHIQFIGEDIGYKPVQCLPGIDEVNNCHLHNKGIVLASQVFQIYKELNKDETAFIVCMQRTYQTPYPDCRLIYNCLHQWSKNFDFS